KAARSSSRPRSALSPNSGERISSLFSSVMDPASGSLADSSVAYILTRMFVWREPFHTMNCRRGTARPMWFVFPADRKDSQTYSLNPWPVALRSSPLRSAASRRSFRPTGSACWPPEMNVLLQKLFSRHCPGRGTVQRWFSMSVSGPGTPLRDLLNNSWEPFITTGEGSCRCQSCPMGSLPTAVNHGDRIQRRRCHETDASCRGSSQLHEDRVHRGRHPCLQCDGSPPTRLSAGSYGTAL